MFVQHQAQGDFFFFLLFFPVGTWRYCQLINQVLHSSARINESSKNKRHDNVKNYKLTHLGRKYSCYIREKRSLKHKVGERNLESSKNLRAWGDGRHQMRHKCMRQTISQLRGKWNFGRHVRSWHRTRQGSKLCYAAAMCCARHLYNIRFSFQGAPVQLFEMGNLNSTGIHMSSSSI